MDHLYPPEIPKTEWNEHALRICSGEIRLLRDEIPALLAWLQDPNWPGYETIAGFLLSQGAAFAPHLTPVLTSGDKIWIQSVLRKFANSFDHETWLPMKQVLEKVAFQWDFEGAHIEALFILARWNLSPKDLLRATVDKMKRHEATQAEDYFALEALLEDG